MSEITKALKLIIYQSDGVTPDLALLDDDLGDELPQYGQMTPRPLEGRTESIPFVVRVVDTSDQLTAKLADSDGRLVALGRIAELQINEGGAGFATVAKGRISAIPQTDGVKEYDVHISDERWLSRRTNAYSSFGTTSLIPSGLVSAFYQFPAIDGLTLVVDSVSGNTVVFRVRESGPVNGQVVEFLRDDQAFGSSAIGLSGAFVTARLRASGADREIEVFSQYAVGGGAFSPLGELFAILINGTAAPLNWLRVYWPSSGFSPGDEVTGAYVYAPSARPSPAVPYHVGGTDGVDPMQELKDVYDAVGQRYDSDAFSTWNESTKPEGLIAHPLVPRLWPRFTAMPKVADLEDLWYGMLGLVPFENASGEITPRWVTMPHDVDPDTLTDVTAAKLSDEEHPTFHPIGRETVTVVRTRFTAYEWVRDNELEDSFSWPVDRMRETLRSLPDLENDRVSDLGEHVYSLDLIGLPSHLFAFQFRDQRSEELFDRFGDGAIRGQLRGMSALDSVMGGDFCVITLATYPNMALQARGGSRLVQVMGKRSGPPGVLEYLDAGPDEQPLSAPTVAIVKTPGATKHSVNVTISNLPAAADGYQLQLKVGANDWQTYRKGTSNETVTIKDLPSNTQIQARARSRAVGRIRSGYSTPVNVTLDAMTAPSGLTVTDITGTSAHWSWTNGESGERIEVVLYQASDTSLATVPSGTTDMDVYSLTPSTSYTAKVRHVDQWGGASAYATANFSTTASADTCPDMDGIIVLMGIKS